MADIVEELTPDEAACIEEVQGLENRLVVSIHRAREALHTLEPPYPQGDRVLGAWVRTFWEEAARERLSEDEARAVARSFSLEDRRLIQEAISRTNELREMFRRHGGNL